MTTAVLCGGLAWGLPGATSAFVPDEPPPVKKAAVKTEERTEAVVKRPLRPMIQAAPKPESKAAPKPEIRAAPKPEIRAAPMPTAMPEAASLAKGSGRVFRDCDECPEMVVIPAGSFIMGSAVTEDHRSDEEGPQHKVTLAQPFAIGKYEVTFDEWDACVAAKGCQHLPHDADWGRGTRPVINVSWEDAQAYAAWLAKKTGKGYRLLSEAEWEYAARAGTTRRYPWGDEPGNNHANFAGAGSAWSAKQTSPAGSFVASAFGVHDMIGNVWEWTQDCWNERYFGAPDDGSPWLKGECGRRVVRGGSWYLSPVVARVAYRVGNVPAYRLVDLGFRVARTL